MQDAGHAVAVLLLDLQHRPPVTPSRLWGLQVTAQVRLAEHMLNCCVDTRSRRLNLTADFRQLPRGRVEHLAAVIDRVLKFFDQILEIRRRGGHLLQSPPSCTQPLAGAFCRAQHSLEVRQILGLQLMLAVAEPREPGSNLDCSRDRERLPTAQTVREIRHGAQPLTRSFAGWQRCQGSYRGTPEWSLQALQKQRANGMELEGVEVVGISSLHGRVMLPRTARL